MPAIQSATTHSRSAPSPIAFASPVRVPTPFLSYCYPAPHNSFTCITQIFCTLPPLFYPILYYFHAPHRYFLPLLSPHYCASHIFLLLHIPCHDELERQALGPNTTQIILLPLYLSFSLALTLSSKREFCCNSGRSGKQPHLKGWEGNCSNKILTPINTTYFAFYLSYNRT